MIKKTKRAAAFISAAVMAASMLILPVSAESTSAEKTVAQIVSEMTTQQKVEQMMMISLRPWQDTEGGEYKNVTALNKELTELIREHSFAGVCLFAPNIHDVRQTVALTTELQQASLDSECGIPMLISADQEGGSIYRLTTGTPTCGNMAIGASRNPDLAEENAKILGSEIMALGINTDLAPVLDVNNNPSSPVINVRSFSSDPAIVAVMGMQYISGLHSEGVITTCKHFPGHGDTSTDSHTGLPLINKSYDELKELELFPYYTAIESGTDMIMTALIQFPQIEKGTYTSISTGEEITIPATLSKTIITGILRDDLCYDGVVITDSMIMSAIKENIDPVDAAALAMNADVDILLEPMAIQNVGDIAKMEKYIKDVAARVESGDIPMSTVDRSVTRILTMKKERGLLSYKAPDAENALKVVGSAEHREKALEIAQSAVTLVKNDNDLLPLDLGENGRAAYFFPYDNVENTMTFALERLKKQGVVSEGVTADCICYYDRTADEFEQNIKDSDVVIVALEMYSAATIDNSNEARGWQSRFVDDLIRLAHKNDKRVVYISAHIPYDTARFADADAVLAAYCANGMDELPTDGGENAAYGVNYPAALITAFGGSSPTAKLPVDIYEVDENGVYNMDKVAYSFGFGLEYASKEEPKPEPENVPADDENKQPETSNEQETGEPEKPDAKSEPAAQADNSSNPKTGTQGVMLICTAALAAAAAVVSKKRR